MKVLMIDQWLPAQPYALELSRQLGRHVQLTLAAPRYYHPDNEIFRTKSVLESKAKTSIGGLLRYFRGVLWQFGAALFGRYDVIHIQAFKKWKVEMPLFALARRLTHKKIVYTAHNILPHEHGDNHREADALRKWYRRCDAIIVHNEHSKKVLTDFEPAAAEKVRVVPHGIFSVYSADVRDKPHEKTVFLQFGMIRKYKGIDDLLRAAAMLPPAYRERVRIVIAGNQRRDLDDTDYRAMLEECGVGDFVSLSTQRIPDDELPDYFNGADCCLFPYKNIYGSGALLMAYTFHKPVIASAIPTFVEETDGGKTGILYDPQEERGLAEAIMRFTDLNEAEKARMQDSIREVCETKYSWEVSARTLAEIYKSI